MSDGQNVESRACIDFVLFSLPVLFAFLVFLVEKSQPNTHKMRLQWGIDALQQSSDFKNLGISYI